MPTLLVGLSRPITLEKSFTYTKTKNLLLLLSRPEARRKDVEWPRFRFDDFFFTPEQETSVLL